jgi:radical SAM superfamily enzyme YgiQ (UPF0313 family)
MHSSGKNLLLINPWIYDFTAFDLWSQPLGLLYIASFLRAHGFVVSYIDCLRSENTSAEVKSKKYGIGNYRREIVETPQIVNDIPRKFARYGISESEFVGKLKKPPAPDAILITSVMTYWYPGPSQIVKIVREIYPDIPIILGGIYASLLPEHAKNVVKPDYIIEGPGEWQVLRLLEEILNHPVDTDTEFKRLDDYPYPAFDLVPNLRYICIMTSRGCPFNCSFCAQKHIAAKFSQRNPEKVVEEIVYHIKKYKLRDFAFYDDALFINKEQHIKVILRKLIEAKLSIRLHTPNGLFIRDIDEELATLMFNTNFKTIRLSYETSNEDRRKDMNNKISNEGMQIAVTNLVKAGYSASDLEAYVIMGLPEQNLDEILESIIFVNNLGVQVRLASFSPIPKTREFERAVRSGVIPENIDPLLTNKTIFPLKSPDLDYETFRKVRIFSHMLNEAAKKNMAPFAENTIGKSLRRILRDSI